MGQDVCKEFPEEGKRQMALGVIWILPSSGSSGAIMDSGVVAGSVEVSW